MSLLHMSEINKSKTMKCLGYYAPFTPGGDCRATGHNSANRHWSLVVAPSLHLVAYVQHTFSKRHGNEKIIFTRLSGIVETQLRHSCVGVAKKPVTAAWRNIANVPQLCLNNLPTVGWQMETVKVKWRVLETMGRQITMTLLKHMK